jgi:ABC-type cobalamin transport system permease subunit
MKPAFSFLLIAVVALTAVNVPSQTSKEGSAESMVSFYGPSGSALLRQCQVAAKLADGEQHTSQQAVDATFCRGYLAGAVDEMVGLSVQTSTAYCIASNVDSDQLLRVLLRYLNDNPAKLNYPAGALVANAIVAAFPCK